MQKQQSTKVNTSVFCVVCGREVSTKETNAIADKNSPLLTHITCSGCGSFSVKVEDSPTLDQKDGSIGIPIDLDFKEAKRVLAQKPLEVDEIIGIFQELSNKQ